MSDNDIKVASYERSGKQDHWIVFENLLTTDEEKLKDLIKENGFPYSEDMILSNVNVDFDSKTTTVHWKISGAAIGGGMMII